MISIGIIGGGASGLMAAIAAARAGAFVTILEANGKPACKLSITGNGKCNITNTEIFPTRNYYYADDEGFVEDVINQASPEFIMKFFKDLGIELITKRDGYIYPGCCSAKALAASLIAIAEAYKVKIKTNCRIISLKPIGDKYKLYTDNWSFEFDRVIVACGSEAGRKIMPENSYLNLLNGLNYKVNQVLPTLTSIKLKDDFLLQHMARLRVEAEASLYVDEKLICRHRGEVQFNRDNISGFPIFQLSHMAVRSINEKKYVKINLDIYPDEAVEELTGRFQREIKALPGISIINFLRPKLPEGLATYVISTAGLSKESMIHSISDSELFNMSHILKNISAEASGYSGFEAAQAAQGGVDVSRIYAASMESKLHSGLYFCGEVIDVDGLCGGYNLQWAWSTGYIAGINAAKASKI